MFLQVCEKLDAMAYIKLAAKYLGARRLSALPSHGRVSKIIYGGRFCVTRYGAWRSRQEEWRNVKEHTEEEMDMSVSRNDLEAGYVPNLSKFACDVEGAGI